MPRCRILIATLVFAIVSGGWLMGDDTKKPDDPKTEPPKTVPHTLPQYWKQLGLSDDQKKKIYSIEDEYTPQINELKKKIEKLQTEEKGKKYAVLTEDQKKRLKELIEKKVGGGEEKKEEKKP